MHDIKLHHFIPMVHYPRYLVGLFPQYIYQDDGGNTTTHSSGIQPTSQHQIPCMVLLVDTPIVHHRVVQPMTSSYSHHCNLIGITHYISIISLRGEAHISSMPLGILHQDALTSFQEHRTLGTHHSLASIKEHPSSITEGFPSFKECL